MAYHVYILQSLVTGRFYIGQTNDVNRRLNHHNKGNCRSTKPFKPWELFYVHEVASRTEAIRLECSLKNLKSRKKIQEWIERKNSESRGLRNHL